MSIVGMEDNRLLKRADFNEKIRPGYYTSNTDKIIKEDEISGMSWKNGNYTYSITVSPLDDINTNRCVKCGKITVNSSYTPSVYVYNIVVNATFNGEVSQTGNRWANYFGTNNWYVGAASRLDFYTSYNSSSFDNTPAFQAYPTLKCYGTSSGTLMINVISGTCTYDYTSQTPITHIAFTIEDVEPFGGILFLDGEVVAISGTGTKVLTPYYDLTGGGGLKPLEE